MLSCCRYACQHSKVWEVSYPPLQDPSITGPVLQWGWHFWWQATLRNSSRRGMDDGQYALLCAGGSSAIRGQSVLAFLYSPRCCWMLSFCCHYSVAQANRQESSSLELEEEQEQDSQVPNETRNVSTPSTPSNCDTEIPDPSASEKWTAKLTARGENGNRNRRILGVVNHLSQLPEVSLEELRAEKYYN